MAEATDPNGQEFGPTHVYEARKEDGSRLNYQYGLDKKQTPDELAAIQDAHEREQAHHADAARAVIDKSDTATIDASPIAARSEHEAVPGTLVRRELEYGNLPSARMSDLARGQMLADSLQRYNVWTDSLEGPTAMYNMLTGPDGKRFTTRHSDQDAVIAQKYDEIKQALVGPGGEPVHRERRGLVQNSPDLFEWHGTPIDLFISDEARTAAAEGSPDARPDIQLYRVGRDWIAVGDGGEQMTVPSTGLQLGRSEQSPQVEAAFPDTLKRLRADTTVSRNHLALSQDPNDGMGGLKLEDKSSNGTFRREVYWARPTPSR